MEQLYCLCQTPYSEGACMLGCEACGEWYVPVRLQAPHSFVSSPPLLPRPLSKHPARPQVPPGVPRPAGVLGRSARGHGLLHHPPLGRPARRASGGATLQRVTAALPVMRAVARGGCRAFCCGARREDLPARPAPPRTPTRVAVRIELPRLLAPPPGPQAGRGATAHRQGQRGAQARREASGGAGR